MACRLSIPKCSTKGKPAQRVEALSVVAGAFVGVEESQREPPDFPLRASNTVEDNLTSTGSADTPWLTSSKRGSVVIVVTADPDNSAEIEVPPSVDLI